MLGDEGASAKHGKGHIATGKMTIQFTGPADTGLTSADTEACALGSVTQGAQQFRFWGCDTVRVLHG